MKDHKNFKNLPHNDKKIGRKILTFLCNVKVRIYNKHTVKTIHYGEIMTKKDKLCIKNILKLKNHQL